MKAAQINRYGSDAVEINKNAPMPDLAEGKVAVEVHAASVNPIDWKIKEGYLKQTKFPATLGGDFSGIVTGIGEGVTELKKGDEVYGQAIVLGGGSGSLAEYLTADAKTVAKKPKKLGHVEAASLPLAGVSAYQALAEHVKLAKGQKILIHGGAGGIGTFAIQIAKHMGAHVTTTASADAGAYLKGLGADEVIDYRSQHFENMAKGYDAVFDTVGGETYRKSFLVLRKGGILVSMTEQPDAELMEKYGVNAIGQFTKVNTERLSKLAELADKGAIKAHIDKIFPLEQAGEALTHLQKGHPKGKVVVKVR